MDYYLCGGMRLVLRLVPKILVSVSRGQTPLHTETLSSVGAGCINMYVKASNVHIFMRLVILTQ